MPVPTTLVASNQLTATITSAHIAQPGVVSLLVADTRTGAQSNPVTFTVTETPNAAGLNIIATSLPNGVAGSSYSRTLEVTGGTAPYTWSLPLGSLPTGLTLAATTGVISGTTTAAGTFNFTVRVTDSASVRDDQPLSIFVDTPPPVESVTGIWINHAQLATRPMSGAAWNSLKAQADSSCAVPDLANQDDSTDVCVLAKALVFGRTKQESYRIEVLAALASIANSSVYNGRALALGRNLAPYVIAADLIALKTHDPVLDAAFRAKLRELLTTFTDSGPSSLVECHEVRPNNWGTYCGASRVAVAVYLDDRNQIERAAQVFKGYLGDRASYAGFTFGSDSASWSPAPATRVPINPKGATVTWDGAQYNVDGAVIDDMRRGCTFQWPPCHTGYAWEALAGALVQAEILHRAGFTPYEWQDRALRRAYEYLHFLHMETGGVWFDDGTVSGDDNWQPWVVNRRYGINLPTHSPTAIGKGMGWTDWTHGP